MIEARSSWTKKNQKHELQILMKRLMIEAKKLEHNLNILRMEHEERKERAAYELSHKLEKQLKRKRCYECRKYGHLATDCTHRDMIFHEEKKRAAHEQSFELSRSTFQVLDTSKDVVLESMSYFDSYGLEEYELPLRHFPHHQGLDSEESSGGRSIGSGSDPMDTNYSELFEEPTCGVTEYELIGEPIFDSYEHEAEFQYSDLYTSDLHLINVETVQHGLIDTYSLVSPTPLEQPMIWGSFVTPLSPVSAAKSLEQSGKNSLKNCYAFKKKGVISKADLQPGVHLDQACGALEPHMNQAQVLKQVPICPNACSRYHELAIKGAKSATTSRSMFAITQCLVLVLYVAKSAPAQFLSSDATIRVLWFFGYGLLDYYIEDDELKDARRLLLLYSASQGSRLQDLRSNLHQPGVYDAGASVQVLSKVDARASKLKSSQFQLNAQFHSSALRRIIKGLNYGSNGLRGCSLVLRPTWDVP